MSLMQLEDSNCFVKGKGGGGEGGGGQTWANYCIS